MWWGISMDIEISVQTGQTGGGRAQRWATSPRLRAEEKENEMAALAGLPLYGARALQKELDAIRAQHISKEKWKKKNMFRVLMCSGNPFLTRCESILKQALDYTYPAEIFSSFPDQTKKGRLYRAFKNIVFPFVGIPSGSFNMGASPERKSCNNGLVIRSRSVKVFGLGCIQLQSYTRWLWVKS